MGMRHAGGIVWVRRAPFHAATNNLPGTALRRCEEQRESGDQCEGAAVSRRVGKINKGCRTAREPAGGVSAQSPLGEGRMCLQLALNLLRLLFIAARQLLQSTLRY